MTRRLFVIGLLLATVLGPSASWAHIPFYSEGKHDNPDTAWPIKDIEVSVVMYHAVTCEDPVLWLSFDTTAPTEIYFQLGVPVIDRLKDYRPTMALLAQGLPPLDEPVPFEVPEGLGGLIFHTTDVPQPESFFEPFTQTDSWILYNTTQALPKPGKGYIVAWNPTRETGKMWVVVGEREDFSNADFSQSLNWLEKTQTFHEKGGYAPKEPVEEVVCPNTDEVIEPDAADDSNETSDTSVCAECDAPVEAPEPIDTASAQDSSKGGGCAHSQQPSHEEGLIILLLIVSCVVLRWRHQCNAALKT